MVSYITKTVFFAYLNNYIKKLVIMRAIGNGLSALCIPFYRAATGMANRSSRNAIIGFMLGL
jgi:hypothetical protein